MYIIAHTRGTLYVPVKHTLKFYFHSLHRQHILFQAHLSRFSIDFISICYYCAVFSSPFIVFSLSLFAFLFHRLYCVYLSQSRIVYLSPYLFSYDFYSFHRFLESLSPFSIFCFHHFFYLSQFSPLYCVVSCHYSFPICDWLIWSRIHNTTTTIQYRKIAK